MERSEINKAFKEIQTSRALLDLLNQIAQEEFGIKKLISTYSFFKQSDASLPKRYASFTIPKKSGGERVISSPNKELKLILQMLNIVLQSIYEPMDNVMGFVLGRSVVDNANAHLGENYVFNIDLKDFFTSIDQQRVRYVLMNKRYGLNFEVANFISWMCCMKQENSSDKPTFVLPQGAPTSPVLTNMVCVQMDKKLSGLARRFGLHFTRYADDITFSSMHNVYQQDGDFQKELRRIVEEHGFTLNEKKTRLQKRTERQDVTGLTVNAKSNVTRKYVKQLRGLLNIWEKYGYEEAYARFYPRYKKEKQGLKKGEPVLENVIAGKLHYLSMVKGQKDSTFQKLMSRYLALTGLHDSLMRKEERPATICLVSFSLSEFETKFNTVVDVIDDVFGKRASFNIGDEQITVAVSKKKSLKKYAEGKDEVIDVACEDNVIKRTQKTNSGLFISLYDCMGKRFWTMSETRPSDVLADKRVVTVDHILDVWEKDGYEAALKEYRKLLSLGMLLGVDEKSQIADMVLTTWEEKGVKAAYEYYNNHKSLLN